MKDTVVLNFKNVVPELESKNLKLCFLKNSNGIFIEDAQGNLYVIETYRHGSYLDRLIKDGIVVEFNRLDNSIEDWKKEIWGVPEVEAFIERHSL